MIARTLAVGVALAAATLLPSPSPPTASTDRARAPQAARSFTLPNDLVVIAAPAGTAPRAFVQVSAPLVRGTDAASAPTGSSSAPAGALPVGIERSVQTRGGRVDVTWNGPADATSRMLELAAAWAWSWRAPQPASASAAPAGLARASSPASPEVGRATLLSMLSAPADERASTAASRPTPRGARLTVTGAIDVERVEWRARELFASWQAPAGATPVGDPVCPAPDESSLKVVRRPGSTQMTMWVGGAVATSSVDAATVDVVNVLVGGTPGSRLFRWLVEEHDYAYGPHSLIIRDGGCTILAVNADIRNAVARPAAAGIIALLDDLVQAPPDAADIDRAVRVVVQQGRMRRSSPRGLLDALALPDAPIAAPGELRAVTPARVAETVRRLLDPHRRAVALVGEPDVVQAIVDDVSARSGSPRGDVRHHERAVRRDAGRDAVR